MANVKKNNINNNINNKSEKEEWNDACNQNNTCALTGAAAFFAGIPDAAIIANGPLWCYFYALRYLEKACPDIVKRFFGTQPDNQAVVYGTEECLMEMLNEVRHKINPSVLLIENSCAVSLIGDDIAGIAAEAKLPWPVVCMDSGGLIGGFWEGYRAAAKKYFQIMPLQKQIVCEPFSVNLLGCTTSYYNARNDLHELKRILSLAGYKVLASPGAGSSSKEIAKMTKAELNIVVHAELGLELAEQLYSDYNIPYVSLLPPYGLEGSINWLKIIGENLEKNMENLQSVRKEVDERKVKLRNIQREMQRLWGELYFPQIFLAAPSSVAIGVAGALYSEWLLTDSLVISCHDGVPTLPLSEFLTTVLDGQRETTRIEEELVKMKQGLLLASSQEKAFLQQRGLTGIACQNIALPVYDEIILHDRPLVGLRGSDYFIERLWNQYMIFCQCQR